MWRAAHGMREFGRGCPRHRCAGAFAFGPADTARTGLPRLFPGESCHVSSDEPMMATMAGRYAAALFELAKDQRQLEQVERDLSALLQMLEASADLRRVVLSPVITTDDQAKAFNAILDKTGVAGVVAILRNLGARNARSLSLC